MMILKIKEPFWSAWKMYGWKEKVPGVGISNTVVGQAIKEKSQVYLYVGKDPILYMIDPQKIIELSKKYNSIKTVGKGVRVAVIPLTSLTVVQGIPSDKKLTEPPPPRSVASGGSHRTIQDCQARLEELRQEAIAKRKQTFFEI